MAHRWSTWSWKSQLGYLPNKHKPRYNHILIHRHDQENNTPWFSVWSLLGEEASQQQAVISGQSRHKRAVHKHPSPQHAVAEPCSSLGTPQHPKGHIGKEQKKQGYVLILHGGTLRPPSQAAAELGSASSIQVSRTKEGQPDGGTRKPPQPPSHHHQHHISSDLIPQSKKTENREALLPPKANGC